MVSRVGLVYVYRHSQWTALALSIDTTIYIYLYTYRLLWDKPVGRSAEIGKNRRWIQDFEGSFRGEVLSERSPSNIFFLEEKSGRVSINGESRLLLDIYTHWWGHDIVDQSAKLALKDVLGSPSLCLFSHLNLIFPIISWLCLGLWSLRGVFALLEEFCRISWEERKEHREDNLPFSANKGFE